MHRDYCIPCILCKRRILLVWRHYETAWRYRQPFKYTGTVIDRDGRVVRIALDLPFDACHSTSSGKKRGDAEWCDVGDGLGRRHWPVKRSEDRQDPSEGKRVSKSVIRRAALDKRPDRRSKRNPPCRGISNLRAGATHYRSRSL